MISRNRTAIVRTGLSRPIRIAIECKIVTEDTTIFDYGCGKGLDIQLLSESGYKIDGWDPYFKSKSKKKKASIVQMGYVVNVTEDPQERNESLRDAWALTNDVLIVAARLTYQNETDKYDCFSDGVKTKVNTFQKYYTQQELKDWIENTLNTSAVSVAPGILFVFRDTGQREDFIATRFRRRGAPRLRISDKLYTEHEDLLNELGAFLHSHGRVPEINELEEFDDLVDRFGSAKRAFQIIRTVTGKEQWEESKLQCEDDLLIHIALAKFRGRPKFSDLSRSMQLDIRKLFGSYKAACDIADGLLLAVGDSTLIDELCKSSPIGKKTPNALYVHVDAIPLLHPTLRVYEGCARSYYGMVEEANIIKLHRHRPKISYLSYPKFDRDAHPSLLESFVISLGSYKVRYFDYKESSNPPVLHRKETFVSADYPKRDLFAKLTCKEDRAGLFEDTSVIGTRDGWSEVLKQKGLEVKGHQLKSIAN